MAIEYKISEIKNKYSFIHNFDLSVIMPFYKKMEEFKKIFPKNLSYFQRNGIEVIVCMDEDSEEEQLLEFIKLYPFINWRIIVNRTEHEWRNPAKALNVGIRSASKKYILVCSPESEFACDIIYQMRRALYYYPNHFTIGFVEFKSFDKHHRLMCPVPYGSIMAKKDDLVKITGYDEQILKWGGDDDNIRARLEMIGIKKLLLPDALLIHWETDEDFEKRITKHIARDRPIDVLRDILYPNYHIANNNTWGTDFKDVAYDWMCKDNDDSNLQMFLKQFIQFDLTIKSINQQFKKLLLVQSYNEVDNINTFLNESAKHFEAIILLDDESTDGTYENAMHEKLILKVQKKRFKFNDLENRNLLLRIASFFNTEWLVFLDVDEILDNRFCDFSFTRDSQIDVVAFHLIHLWNQKDTFNGEYPYSEEGIQLRFRMFRNIGYSQILTDKEALHFPLTPYFKNILPAKILIIHLGHLSEKKRKKKLSFYLEEDKLGDQRSYRHLLNDNPKLRKIKDITYDSLNVKLF